MATLLGVKIEQFSHNQVLRRIKETKAPLFIATLNPEILLHAWRNSEYRKILNQADLRAVDGVGIVMMARLLYGVKLERFAGADLADEIIKIAAQKKWRVFLLGGSEEVNRRAVRHIISNFQLPISNEFSINQFSNLKGLGGEFSNKEVVNAIHKFNPDILFVALGAPKQEIFIKNFLQIPNSKFQIPKIMMGIGGSINYWAYPQLRAPHIVRQIGFEWFWRLILQPWRLPRILKATILFPLTCLYEWILLK